MIDHTVSPAPIASIPKSPEASTAALSYQLTEHGKTRKDLQVTHIAALLGERAELLFALEEQGIAPHLLPEVAHHPANFLLSEATYLMNDKHADRAVHMPSHTREGVESYTAVLTTVIEEDDHQWLSPELILRMNSEPDANGDLVPQRIAIGLARRNKLMGEGRYIFSALGGGDPQATICEEYWRNGAWQRQIIEDEEKRASLLERLFLRLEDGRDRVSNEQARRKMFEWLNKGSGYLL